MVVSGRKVREEGNGDQKEGGREMGGRSEEGGCLVKEKEEKKTRGYMTNSNRDEDMLRGKGGKVHNL